MKRITAIRIVKEPDTTSTPDYLGTYASEPEAYAIDRKEQRDWRQGQFRYFNPARAGSPEDAAADYQRAEAFNNSEWSYIVVRAVATVETSHDGKTWLSNQIGSAGLWGVESDSDDDYIASIGDEELLELKAALEEFGFSSDDIACITPA